MTLHPPADANFITGTQGLIAIDKIGNQVLFLDPQSYATVATLDDFVPRVHEVTISADRTTAYIPIYGDGKHGDNPHPGHLIAVVDLPTRRHVGNISTAPYLAPHGLRWGPQGQLYCLCENSGVLLEMDAQTGETRQVIQVGSNNAHRMEILPDGSKVYTENEEDAFVSVIDLQRRGPIKNIEFAHILTGIGMAPDGKTLVAVDGAAPQIMVIDSQTDTVIRTIALQGYHKAAQIARYSPDGRYLVVTSHDEPLATVFSADLERQTLVQLGDGPMNMAFTDDGRTVLIANHDAGTLSVVELETGQVVRTVAAGKGVETLGFF